MTEHYEGTLHLTGAGNEPQPEPEPELTPEKEED